MAREMYTEAELNVIEFAAEDVITASGEGEGVIED